MCQHVGTCRPYAHRVNPETEEKINAVKAAFDEKTAADALAAQKTEAYHAALAEALATGARGVQAELSRRLPRHRDTLRLDADEAKRRGRIKRRTQ